MPTAKDFDLVLNWFSCNPLSAENVTSQIDATSFLLSFVCQLAPLRLIVCALAAFFTKQDEKVTLGYYYRAVKAISRIDLRKPSIASVAAFVFIQEFCIGYLGVTFGKPYFLTALRQMSQLALDIDPDDSPWLYHLNLTQVQKEERRRIFWSMCYYHYQLLSISRDEPNVILNLSSVKPMKAIPGTSFHAAEFIPWECKILAVISKIKASFAEPPLDPFDLIASSETINLGAQVLSLAIPPQFILTTSSGELTPDEHANFVAQLSGLSARGEATGTIGITLFYNAAICILHHPKLLLLGFLPFTATFSAEQVTILSLAIDQAIAAAVEISVVCEFLLAPVAGPNSPQNLKFWGIQLFTAVSMFQGLTTLWFVACRLPLHWWISKRHSRFLMKRAMIIAQVIHQLDSGHRPNQKPFEMLQPLVRTSEAMLQEMNKMIGERDDRPSPFSEQSNLDDLIVSMKVLSVGKVEVPDSRQEPWSHLGMMGVELEGGIRWYGRFEIEWREFWNSLSLLE
ncbi:hypothetical protein BCR33DRAFT_711768 [Rhizoclosmatium globosum]|uniref:Transcription factor domain-containing protein n=1 Tax=Rhizoclosmatium globosum TaxID=329046 RepID=A0A1Y2D008_9FUNG|nr:hypothetical protein BCR33DRAFT_711768 [Rhizoclosmatium globosum]|eukprot:ORY52454.1 hypothetical protein BCR33DRAFT_711768 [Rhizoclosmatium globosum]